MSMKSTTSFAVVGMILLTVLMFADLIQTVLGVVRGFIPAMALLRAVIYAFASATGTMFLLVFHERE